MERLTGNREKLRAINRKFYDTIVELRLYNSILQTTIESRSRELKECENELLVANHKLRAVEDELGFADKDFKKVKAEKMQLEQMLQHKHY